MPERKEGQETEIHSERLFYVAQTTLN